MPVTRPILAPTDLDEHSVRGVRYGAELAAELGAELLVLHVATLREMGDVDTMRHQEEDLRVDVLERSRQALRTHLAEALGEPDVKVRRLVVFGDPVTDILRTSVEESCHLIVISLENRSRLGKLIFGSVAQEVLLNATVPVVSVPRERQP